MAPAYFNPPSPVFDPGTDLPADGGGDPRGRRGQRRRPARLLRSPTDVGGGGRPPGTGGPVGGETQNSDLADFLTPQTVGAKTPHRHTPRPLAAVSGGDKPGYYDR